MTSEKFRIVYSDDKLTNVTRDFSVTIDFCVINLSNARIKPLILLILEDAINSIKNCH